MQPAVSEASPESRQLERIMPLVWSRARASQLWVFIVATLFLVTGASILVAGAFAFIALSGAAPIAQAAAALSVFIACLWLIPAVILYRYAARLRRAVQTSMLSHLLRAYRTQSRFWRYAAGVFLAYVALVAILRALEAAYPELAGLGGKP